MLRSLETLREFSHTSLPAFSVDLGVQNFGISKKGGLPRTLCNVQAVVSASAKGSPSSDPRGAKRSASSDPPCSPCACAPWMTRKLSKRAHTNSRRSRSRHEEITGLQVMLGRMFALKVQCDLPEGLAVVLRRCPWTSAEKLMQRVQDGTFSSRKLAMVCFWARLGDQVFPGTEQEARPRHRRRMNSRYATCSSTPSMKGARESDIRQGNVPRVVQSRVATAGADANRGVWTRTDSVF